MIGDKMQHVCGKPMEIQETKAQTESSSQIRRCEIDLTNISVTAESNILRLT